MSNRLTQKKDAKIIMRCSSEFKKELIRAATKEDLDLSTFIRIAVKEKLSKS